MGLSRITDATRQAIHELSDNQELDSTLWKSTRHPDIPIPCPTWVAPNRRFLDAYTRLPNPSLLLPQGLTIDNLDHHFFRCQSPERTTIWSLTNALWPQTHGEWPQITLGTIMGCGTINLHTPADHPTPPHPLVQQSTTIPHPDIRSNTPNMGHSFTITTMAPRWLTKINHRLTIDRSVSRTDP